MEDQAKGGEVAISTIKDLIAVAIPALVAISQYLAKDRSYETLAVCGFCLMLYILYRQNQEKIKMLTSAAVKQEAHTVDCERRLESMEQFFKKYNEVTNLSLVNMYRDLLIFAGSRRVGKLETHSETGAMVYISAEPSTPPPGLGERRGPFPDAPAFTQPGPHGG